MRSRRLIRTDDTQFGRASIAAAFPERSDGGDFSSDNMTACGWQPQSSPATVTLSGLVLAPFVSQVVTRIGGIAMRALFGSLIVVGLVIWFGGIRIVSIAPSDQVPNGVSAVMFGLSGLNVRLIDSPEAMCLRETGSASHFCSELTATALTVEGEVIGRLPFNNWLHRLTGASAI